MIVLLVVYTIQTTMITSSSANNEFIDLIKIGDNKMKKLTVTKTGNVHGFTSISEEAGNNQGEAYDILDQLCDLEENGVTGINAWADLMVDDKYETIIAIAAEDALTCWDANVVFVELEEQEYPEFYKAMREFHDTKNL